MKSIICDAEECYICGAKQGLHTHHVLDGIRRKKADEDGLTVRLCWQCHKGIHDKGEVKVYGKVVTEYDLKQQAQMAWMYHYGAGIDRFRERYGKSYV